MEATFITGPAKNLLQYAEFGSRSQPSVKMHVATIRRFTDPPIR
jgi:hypothetical protein